MESRDEKLHIVMLPWLAFGHMIPFLELSQLIAQKGHRVSYISTPKNIEKLPKLQPDLNPLINFVKFPLSHVDNLPENAEATIDLPYNKVKYLKKAYDDLQKPIAQFLQDAAPDWVIHDFAPYWICPIAAELGIPTVFFSIFMAATLCFSGSVKVLKGEEDRVKPEDFTVSPPWVPFESNVAMRLFEIKRIFDDLSNVDDENIPGTYRMGECIEGCALLAVRSSYEFEPEWWKLLPEIHPKPVLPVGHMPPTAYIGGADADKDDGAWSRIKEWLDKQCKGSVVYTAFGSESQPSQDEVTEIALGLELSELPFFWVLRKRPGCAVTELPDGFEERTKGRGVVCMSWAPQLKILSHDSVGGFMTHSGWSSVIEAIQFEKPMVVLTFLADTGLVARVLEEKKMAYVIPREEEDGFFTRDSVAESLRLVVVEEEGKIYRERVKEMRGVLKFGDRDMQDKYVNNLLDHLIRNTNSGAPKEKCSTESDSSIVSEYVVGR